MGLLVEFKVLLVDKLVMGRECGEESTENLQTEPWPLLQVRVSGRESERLEN